MLLITEACAGVRLVDRTPYQLPVSPLIIGNCAVHLHASPGFTSQQSAPHLGKMCPMNNPHRFGLHLPGSQALAMLMKADGKIDEEKKTPAN